MIVMAQITGPFRSGQDSLGLSQTARFVLGEQQNRNQMNAWALFCMARIKFTHRSHRYVTYRLYIGYSALLKPGITTGRKGQSEKVAHPLSSVVLAKDACARHR